jgi:hypothetical protein
VPGCSRDQALAIAIKYLGEQYLGMLHVGEDLPSFPLYDREKLEGGWVIEVPQIGTSHVGSGRYIVISKDTGGIVFDGMLGE